MNDFVLGLGTAAWLGVLTSISPCPLATNIAAISYLGREVSTPKSIVLSGVAYTAGRSAAYLALASIILAGLLSMPDASMGLQSLMNNALGPLLVIVGIFLLGVIPLPAISFGHAGERGQAWAAKKGKLGAALLGGLFALSFCPFSAALFFGSLIPLSLSQRSWVLMPALFGIGTAAPVVAFALVLGYGSHSLAKSFDRIKTFETWSRRVTAVVFIAIGVYMIC